MALSKVTYVDGVTIIGAKNLNDIQDELIRQGEQQTADEEATTAALALKADKSTTYTKTEVDSALALKADKSDTYTKAETYTKTEVNTALALKADKSDTYTKTETYTKAQVDSIVEDAIAEAVKESEYSNFEMKSVSGDFIHITDGAGLIPVKDLKIGIDAVQDLHGYDAPWVGGAGKNILDYAHPTSQIRITSIADNGDGSFTVTASGASATMGFVIPVTANQTYVVYCESAENVSGNANQMANLNVYDGEDSTATHIVTNQSINGSAKTFTPTGNKVYVVLGVTGGSGAGVGKITKPQIELGSTPTSYAPYSNICPISGWTGAKVTRTGKNLFDLYNTVAITGGTMYGTKVRLPQGTTLYIMRKGGTSSSLYGLLEDGSVEAITSISTDNHKYTVTLSKDYYGVLLSYTAYVAYKNNNGTLMVSVEDFTDVEQYNGTTYFVTWQTEAGTVYGGTLDVTTGVGKITSVEVDLGSLNWSYLSSAGHERFEVDLPLAKAVDNSKIANIICSIYAKASYGDVYGHISDGIIAIANNKRAYVYDSAYSDKDTFKTAVTGQQFVYELDTPQSFTIDPTTDIVTLLGENNIFADTGVVEELIYRISRQ